MNFAQTWAITGAGSGSLSGGAPLTFANVESLRGGTDADAFVFAAAGSLAGTIDGNLGHGLRIAELPTSPAQGAGSVLRLIRIG